MVSLWSLNLAEMKASILPCVCVCVCSVHAEKHVVCSGSAGDKSIPYVHELTRLEKNI